MSALESSVQDLLTALAYGDRRIAQSLADLTPEESFRLARWATKTAYVLDRATPGKPIVPESHAHALCSSTGCLPQQVNVFVGLQSSDTRIAWHCSRTWYGKHLRSLSGIGRDDFKKMTAKSYKIGLLVGRLLLLVAFFPSTDWFMATAKGVHRILWPCEAVIGEWKPNLEALAQTSKPLLRMFSDDLLIVHNASLISVIST